MVQQAEIKTALLWDESFLWGLMACQAFCSCGIPFEIVTAEEVQQGVLGDYDLLFVPGGWAGDKYKALGKQGRNKVRAFVQEGGRYIGFCGGAGLALDVKEGLALVPVKRVPTRDRIPNFSGRIRVTPTDPSHPLWQGLSKPISFYAWWPGQFSMDGNGETFVVGSYGKPERDFYVADLFAGDVESSEESWKDWEKLYGIHMNPSRLEGEPAILEGEYGSGEVFLSYLHLDTPGDPQGLQAFRNLFSWSLHKKTRHGKESAAGSPADCAEKRRGFPVRIEEPMLQLLDEINKRSKEFIAFGQRNYLWFWRTPYLLQWRRGIRGMEYCMIRMISREISKRLYELYSLGKCLVSDGEEDLMEELTSIAILTGEFFGTAKELLMKERFALNSGTLQPLRNSDPEIQGLRETLFSGSKRFGGAFKDLLDRLDRVLLMTFRS